MRASSPLALEAIVAPTDFVRESDGGSGGRTLSRVRPLCCS